VTEIRPKANTGEPAVPARFPSPAGKGVISVHRTLVLAMTPVVAAPLLAMFLAVGGVADRHVAGTPTPVAEQTGCPPPPACPQGFARPLEC
jgi:hypothetical protein